MTGTPIFDGLAEEADRAHVLIDGKYKVDPAMVDRFYDMRTGQRITDAQWDEDKRRLELGEAIDDAR